MIDHVKINVRAGHGGKGHTSFVKIRGKTQGRPDGGNGGPGGNVYLKSDISLSTLQHFKYQKDFKAQDGQDGGRNNKTGATGEDLILKVPSGTIVRLEDGRLLADLSKKDSQILVALGGKGGKGNSHLKRSNFSRLSSREKYQAIHETDFGEDGEQVSLELELKLGSHYHVLHI